jgi:hypothetical protein
MTNALILTDRNCRMCKEALPASAHFNATLCVACKPKAKKARRQESEAEWSSGRSRNLMDRQGAERLCRQIKRYWAERGFEVEARAVRDAFHPSMRSARYDVRSDMKNGWPRG